MGYAMFLLLCLLSFVMCCNLLSICRTVSQPVIATSSFILRLVFKTIDFYKKKLAIFFFLVAALFENFISQFLSACQWKTSLTQTRPRWCARGGQRMSTTWIIWRAHSPWIPPPGITRTKSNPSPHRRLKVDKKKSGMIGHQANDRHLGQHEPTVVSRTWSESPFTLSSTGCDTGLKSSIL